MTRQHYNYFYISIVIIVTLIFLIETWLSPDAKGIGHALIYFGLAIVLSFAGTVIIVVSFFNKKNWVTFLKIFLGLLNSLYFIVLLWSLSADVSIILLLSFTTLTGFILLGLIAKQIYSDNKTKAEA